MGELASGFVYLGMLPQLMDTVPTEKLEWSATEETIYIIIKIPY